MDFLYVLIVLLSLAVGISVGLFLILRPKLAIEIQRKAYAKMNWNLEPIVMQRKIDSTRAWGLYLIVISVLLVAIFFMNMALTGFK